MKKKKLQKKIESLKEQIENVIEKLER